MELLFLRKGNLMQQLLVISRLDLHENAVDFGAAFVLPDREGLATLGRTLVNHAKLGWWMLTEKIPENKFSLCFAVRFNLALNGHVNGLI